MFGRISPLADTVCRQKYIDARRDLV